MLMLNKTPAAITNSNIALLPDTANRALVRFRMTSSNKENGFVGLAAATANHPGLTSAPQCPQALQVNLGSRSDSYGATTRS